MLCFKSTCPVLELKVKFRLSFNLKTLLDPVTLNSSVSVNVNVKDGKFCSGEHDRFIDSLHDYIKVMY